MKHPVQKLTLALCSLAGGLLVANWIAERWLPVPAMILRVDPELLFVPVPGARRVLPVGAGSGGGWIETAINRAGMRGSELVEPKSAARIVVLGDSLVMAETVALRETFVERLAQHLREAGTGAVEALNAGVSGYGPDQECLWLEREIARLSPDLVVLVLCAHNDFGDLVRDKLFRIDERGGLVSNHATLAPSLVAHFEELARATRRPALLRALERVTGSRAAAPAAARPGAPEPRYIELYLAGGADEYAEFVVEHNDVVRSLFQDYYDADVAIHPEWPSSAFKRQLMQQVLARIKADCEQRRVPLVAVIVPSSVDLCPGFAIHVDPKLHPSWSPTRLTDAYAEILRALELPFVDLNAPFREAGPEGLYMGRGDFHWNGAGQDLAARKTADLLLERGLWPPGASARRLGTSPR